MAKKRRFNNMLLYFKYNIFFDVVLRLKKIM